MWLCINKPTTAEVPEIYIFIVLLKPIFYVLKLKFHKGDIAGTIEDINIIRRRTHCNQLYASVNLGDIMNERARELNMEEWRFTELSRVSYCLALSGKAIGISESGITVISTIKER